MGEGYPEPNKQPLTPIHPEVKPHAFENIAHHLEGERRVVTVLVTDLTDSTRLLEKLGTEGWVELMHNIIDILESEIYRFGGEISQFRGDGLVAIFGATSAHEDDPERAILTALSMQNALQNNHKNLTQAALSEIKMRVGVNTGEVIVTNINNRPHWEETAMGMAVAVAARMEAAAEPGTILVSENTFNLVNTLFKWQTLGAIPVKGVSQPIGTYKPLAHITDPGAIARGIIFTSSVPLIGRDVEFQALKDGIKNLLNGRGHIATITGDKGSGKSFLLKEIQQYFLHRRSLLEESQSIPSIPPYTWITGRCRSYNQAWPYSLWIDLFRNWLQFSPDDSAEIKVERLHETARNLLGNSFDEHYPYIASFLGLPLEKTQNEKIKHLEAEVIRQRLFIAIRSWIEACAQKGPLVLALTDLHWADNSSLSLLRYCLPVCDDEAVFWALAFRQERDSEILEFERHLNNEFPHRLTSINLKPLTEEQSLELINQVIGASTLPQKTCELIFHNALGNPYYILEFLQVLANKGVLFYQAESNKWTAVREISSLDLPESIQQILNAQIDRLTDTEHLVFQTAAVSGSYFWFNMLQYMLNQDDTLSMKTVLASLQRSQLIEEIGRTPHMGMQYAIHSPLLRDAVYDNLLTNQRIAYHLKAAEYLETLPAPEIAGGYDGLLAYHYRGAGNQKKELFYTLLAADRAKSIYANNEALQHYNRSLELLDHLQRNTQSADEIRHLQTERFEVLNDRRQVLHLLGKLKASQQDAEALLPLAKEMWDDEVWMIDALLAQYDHIPDSTEELNNGLNTVREACRIAQKIGDKHREMLSLVRLTNFLFSLRDYSAHDTANHALALARELGDIKTEVSLLIRISQTFGLDDLARNREYLQAALSKSESLNDKAIELSLLEGLSHQFERQGDYFTQLTQYEQKRLALSREIGNRLAEGNALNNCGQIQALYLGDYDGGLELVKQALNIWKHLNVRLYPLLRIAQIQTAKSNFDEAVKTLEIARPLSRNDFRDVGRAGLGLVEAIINWHIGDREHLQDALHILANIQQMVADHLISEQYKMTAAYVASNAHLKLAILLGELDTENNITENVQQSLHFSRIAVEIYERFGFTQVVETTGEDILFCHSNALSANHFAEESEIFLSKAYDEMMRKYTLIPEGHYFQKTYLENIQTHREIISNYLRKKHP